MKKIKYTPIQDGLSWREVANLLITDFDPRPEFEETSSTVTIQGRQVPAVTLHITFDTPEAEQRFRRIISAMKRQP